MNNMNKTINDHSFDPASETTSATICAVCGKEKMFHASEYSLMREEHVMSDNIILENLSDKELLDIVDELQKETFEENSVARKLAKQFFETDSIISIGFLSSKLLPIVAERMKAYSPYYNL